MPRNGSARSGRKAQLHLLRHLSHVGTARDPGPQMRHHCPHVACTRGVRRLNRLVGLVRRGYSVTVFESGPKAGGMMRYGIPEYRLPKEVLDDEISYIEELGVEIKTNAPMKSLEGLFDQGYKAVFLATGAWTSQKIGVPGEESEGVVYALDFLKNINSRAKVKVGNKVTVIGGGSVAIDAARLSRRLGAKEVHLICLESTDLTCKDRMPAQDLEIEQAKEEGVIVLLGHVS